MALLELILAITLAGEVQHIEDGSADIQASQVEQTLTETSLEGLKEIPAGLNLQARSDYRISPIEETQATVRGQSMYEHTIQETAATTGQQCNSSKYLREIGQTIGCPYYQFAQYLTYCRPEKRQSAWNRIIRERSLFFDKKSVQQFEAVSRKYAFL